MKVAATLLFAAGAAAFGTAPVASKYDAGLDMSALQALPSMPRNDRGCDDLTEQTRATIISFMNKVWWGYPKDVAWGVSTHYNDNMIQHEPATADGKQGFVDGVSYYLGEFGESVNALNVRPIHVIAEGDFGISHSKYHLDCTDGFFSDNVDLFRMENGKIAEEWDVYNWDQIVPEEERANSNTYFGQAPVTSTVDCSFSAKAKEVAMGFMQGTFYGGVDINKYKAAADKYYAPQYIEHNPYTPNENGREDFKSTMEFVLPANPNMKWEMQKVIADGNYVAFISRVWYDSMAGGDNRGLAIVDIYRVNPETMLIEEHWDIDMEIPDPAESANANGVWSLGGAYSTGTSSDF